MSVTTTSDIYDSIPRSSGPSVNSKVPPNARGTNKPTKKHRRAWRRPVHSFNGSSITVAVVCKLSPRHNSSHLTALPFTAATTVPENEPVLAVVTKHPFNCSNVELSPKRYRREPTTKEVGRETVPNVTLSPRRLGEETVPNVTLSPRRFGGREIVPNVTPVIKEVRREREGDCTLTLHCHQGGSEGGRLYLTLQRHQGGSEGEGGRLYITLHCHQGGWEGEEGRLYLTLQITKEAGRERATVPNATLSPRRLGGRGRETVPNATLSPRMTHQGWLRMTPALRWAAMRAIFMFHLIVRGKVTRYCPTDHNLWRERRADPKLNRAKVFRLTSPTNAMPLTSLTARPNWRDYNKTSFPLPLS